MCRRAVKPPELLVRFPVPKCQDANERFSRVNVSEAELRVNPPKVEPEIRRREMKRARSRLI